MNNYYRHVENLPVLDGYDVIVFGGGIAGISAAVSASRSGSRVLLVEKLCNAGGLATGGLISYYLPVCDGRGKIVSSGIAYELLKLAVENAPAEIKGNVAISKDLSGENKRAQSHFYPAVMQTVLDDFLWKNGVSLLYDTFAETPIMDGCTCKGVILSRREGRAVYRAKVYIDATGDASIMHKAGVETVAGDNMLSGWFYTLSSDGYFKLSTIGADAHEAFENSHDNVPRSSYRGLTSADVSDYVKHVKRRIWQEEARAGKAGERFIVSIPSVPQLRCHRRIVGTEELGADSINKHCETSVGCVSDWREPGIVYEIPFGILLSGKADNIITAGRTVSAFGDAYEVIRCIPQCSVTGEAAGAAASLFCYACLTSVNSIQVSQLQSNLQKAGVLIHIQ